MALGESAFAVAIRGKADTAFFGANFRFLTESGHRA
jgi:hypothetical protein